MSFSCCGAVHEIRGRTDFVFALAGNPNVGKSSIFNTLTGTGAVTANYPGKTVEINVASTRLEDLRIGLVDLPGTYALGAVSEDQWVARQGILDGNPDVVIVILDATNLTRNLYMLLQLLDMGYPVVAALNLFDQAKKKGIEIDVTALSRVLGIPVVPTVATHGEGLQAMLAAAVSAARAAQGESALDRNAGRPTSRRRYGQDVEQVVEELSVELSAFLKDQAPTISARGLALLLLENDAQFVELVRDAQRGPEILEIVRRGAERISAADGESAPLRVIRERHRTGGRHRRAGADPRPGQGALLPAPVAPHHGPPHRSAHPRRGPCRHLRLPVRGRRFPGKDIQLPVGRRDLPADPGRHPCGCRQRRDRQDPDLGSRRRHRGSSGRRHPIRAHLLFPPRLPGGQRLPELRRLPYRQDHAQIRAARPFHHPAAWPAPAATCRPSSARAC